MKKTYDVKYTHEHANVILADKSKNPRKNGILPAGPTATSWNKIQGVKQISEEDYTGRRS